MAGAAPSTSRRQWRVEFARFFPMPSPVGPFPHPELSVKKVGKSKGTWLPADGEALVTVVVHACDPVVRVSVGRTVFEEHRVADLAYSWPQVSCVPECPIRGSRVVFASFYDESNEKQKFAMRFSGAAGAEEFIDCVKECLSKKLNYELSGNSSAHEGSVIPDHFASCEVVDTCDDQSTAELSVAAGTEEQQEPQHKERGIQKKEQHSLQKTRVGATVNTDPRFPPRFTEMLSSCSSVNGNNAAVHPDAADQDQDPVQEDPRKPPINGVFASAEGEAAAVLNGEDIMSRVVRYLSDDQFNAMLGKLDSMIHQLEGGSML